MKKISILFTMLAMVLGFSSCKQEDEPKYHPAEAASFTVNRSPFEDTEFRTNKEMTDKETINVYCSQPDYGYSAICNYSALVSLDPNAPEEEWIAVPNETPTSAQMAIKTYEIGVAVNLLLGVEDQEQFDASDLWDRQFKVYIKAVCEIPNVEGSRVVSQNAISFNRVYIQYAEKLPAWIFICGDIENIETGVANGFTAPSEGNYDAYKENWVLYEPEDLIGSKLYVGVFNLVPKESAVNGGTGPDDCAQFRFFTELLGWVPDASLGSNEADFYSLPITDKWEAGYTGDIVEKGLGNWGVLVTEKKPITIVVDQTNLKIYCKEGVHSVTFVGRDPEFGDPE
ncbi:MAG: hypothetical protein K2J70_08145 [Muribaculaceae bacterium]|nr:hypothetical protein [Muribaculaceae bacterium]